MKRFPLILAISLLCACNPRPEKEIVVSIPADALQKDPAQWEVFHEAISPDFNALRNRIHLIALKESPEKAHAMFLKLADECHAKGEYALEACALYEMSTNYLDQRDTLGMRRLLDRMERLSKEHPENTGAGYSYYSVLGTYYASLYEQDGSDATRDAMFKALREAIRYQERMTQRDYQQQAIVPAWNYYNVAVCYDLYCDPSVRDSIDKYLVLADKANRETLYLQPFEHQQIDVSIRDLRAWLLYYDGRVEEAIAEMNEVLALIDSVEASSPNTVITERGEAYGFFVEVYSSMGDYEKALEYERLKAENDAVRFSAQRNAAVREVEAKYDVAKVETRLAKVRGWAASLAILSLLLLSMVLYYRLLIRSKEESRYTAAVEALVETDSDIRALTETVSPEAAKKVFSSAQIPLSAVERKYILLFMSGNSTEKIAEAMNVEPASVYTMKYRIKKKFREGFPLPF